MVAKAEEAEGEGGQFNSPSPSSLPQLFLLLAIRTPLPPPIRLAEKCLPLAIASGGRREEEEEEERAAAESCGGGRKRERVRCSLRKGAFEREGASLSVSLSCTRYPDASSSVGGGGGSRRRRGRERQSGKGKQGERRGRRKRLRRRVCCLSVLEEDR